MNNLKKVTYRHLIGCSSNDLVKYLEIKFTHKMNLSNYGNWAP